MSPAAATSDVPTRFEAIFDAELPYVWTSLRRLGVQPRDLEDVAHELFLQVLKRLPGADPTRPLRPWLFAFAVRFAADYRRLARHRTELLGDVEHASSTPSPEATLALLEREQLVLRALEEIEPERRAIFVLHELDEVPMSEIAVALDVPINTGYSRLRVAREEFVAAVRRFTQRGKEIP